MVGLMLTVGRTATAQTVGDWGIGNTIIDQDKAYTLTAFSPALATLPVAFTTSMVGTDDLHTVSFGGGPGLGFLLNPGLYSIAYDVDIIGPSIFKSVDLDEVVSPTISGRKTVANSTGALLAILSNGQTTNLVGGGYQSLKILDEWTVAAPGEIFSSANSFLQDNTLSNIPEPSTFALVGLAGVLFGGAGFMRRRRAAKAA
jgi:hypothetical protein